ncbi:MAG: LamG domain-containing protein, partial [Deltaproteobacteria bacterium]|nr:LamG domain-containing protein [Deltaproteobacteria bacterium]
RAQGGERPVQTNMHPRTPLVLGFSLLILPAVIVSLSPKMQSQVSFGVGYLPVYVQYFGLALLLAILLTALKKRSLKGVLVGVLVLAAASHAQNNRKVSEFIKVSYQIPRDLLAAFLRDKEFRNFPEGSIIFFDQETQIHNKAFIKMMSGKKTTVQFGYKNFTDPAIQGEKIYIVTELKFPLGSVKYTKSSSPKETSSYSSLMQADYRYDKGWIRLPTTEAPARMLPEAARNATRYHASGNYTSFKMPALGTRFAIELILRPALHEMRYAHIIGNHPGSLDHTGFALQLMVPEKNQYGFGFGNGKRWSDGVYLEIPPEQWSYVIVNVNGAQVTGYVNGQKIVEKNVGVEMKESDYWIDIGNWVNKDRPFAGDIREVRLRQEMLTEDEIRSNWERVAQMLQIPEVKAANPLVPAAR